MPADGGEVNGGADEDEAVPDGVRERYDAVALEEHDADHVDDTAGGQLTQPGHLLLYVANTVDKTHCRHRTELN